jgi:Ca2+-binding EF-hand superfamily protein
MRATTIVMLAAALVLARTATAADGDPRKQDPRAAFAETDLNRDGAVDHAEFQERIHFIFFAADGNKDGFLDATELKQLAFPEDFTANDKDKNGRVSMREFLRVRFNDFTVADQNDDGVLAVEEVVDAYEGRKRR